ncbi:acylphosphatase [Halorarum salinum]|uniref:acylphosphatase n=1 Tax=Halorarum salinum TaxID=2743089 RepID=A0A7D5QAS6_9EURY|nr:acylphosphatase [Halobaculum salinum]QLG61699.1 acylphosphatase [Halobaculum salinum]
MSGPSDEGTDHEATDERVRAHVFVTGRVQGVYYRDSTREAARERGVDGWVRNLDDGRVEAVFEGPRDAVEGMVEWCHTGSDAAVVEDVDVEYGDPEGETGFVVRR